MLESHSDGVLVAIAVKTDFMARVNYHATFFGEGFEGVSRYKPCGCDVVLFEELEKATNADCACEETAGDVAGGVFTAVGAEPACYCVYVY